VEIIFTKNELRKLANDYRKCCKEMGNIRAELYHKRLNDLRDAETLEDVRYLPGHYHELKEDRKGEWACYLDQPYRLIFKPHENPIPITPDGKYIWNEIKCVEIIEIIDYH
jgi:proteic killer suppression protein